MSTSAWQISDGLIVRQNTVLPVRLFLVASIREAAASYR